MLDHFRRCELDVAMEGLHITPEWVSTLELSGYQIRAAFVGFTSADHTENIVAHARQNERDWINDWLARHNNDTEQLRAWVARQAADNILAAKQAKKLGYAYFDVSSMPFAEYVKTVRQYLLGEDRRG